jgi:hypothetical protein
VARPLIDDCDERPSIGTEVQLETGAEQLRSVCGMLEAKFGESLVVE